MPKPQAEDGRELPECPYPLEPNSNQGWVGREPTPDEIEIVAWLRARTLPSRILHVGVGNALLSTEFGDRVIQGLTKDGGEAEKGKGKGLDVIVCNKYDVGTYKNLLRNPFDCIVDVNVRSYACCDSHFRDYMGVMLESLAAGGMLLTSRRGLGYLVPTSLPELRTLCPRWRVRAHGNVVVMRRSYTHEFRKLFTR